MALDVRTLMFMLAVIASMMTLTLWAGIDVRASGLRRWNAALGLISLACVLFALRGIAPDILTLPFANAALVAGLLLQADSIKQFRGLALARWVVPAGFAGAFLLLFPMMRNYQSFTAIASLLFAASCTFVAIIATRIEAADGRARWLLVGMNLISALALVARSLSVVVDPAGYPSLLAPQPVQQVVLVILSCTVIGGSFAFLLLHRDQAEAEAHRLATTDGLTGLLNRRAFLDQAGRELARARRAAVPFAVLMLDLDHFKRVNDVHGHQAGDRVLADFAARLSDCLRTEDLVGRYGGEEFCAILPGAATERALAIGERIRASAFTPPLGGLAEPVSVSVGVVVCPAENPALTLDHAIARADEALYDAKRQGRNRVVAVPCDAPPPLALAA